jgi:hypothetical protein
MGKGHRHQLDMNGVLCVVEVKLSNGVDLGSRNAGDEYRIKSPNSGWYGGESPAAISFRVSMTISRETAKHFDCVRAGRFRI